MPNCFKCGALYGRGDDFCPKCGERLAVNKLRSFILIAIIIIGIGLFFVLKISKINSTTSSELPTAMATANPTSEEKNNDYYKKELRDQAEEDSLSEENLEDTQTITPPKKLPQEVKKCEWGYTDEYKCDGKKILQKWMNSDCSFEWFYYLTCYYGCETGECKEKPEEETKICNYGYLEEYKCDGDDIQKKYQHSNCSFSWVFNELCSYGCENAKCKPCEDTDNGKDYYTKGYIYYSVKGKVYDECDTNAGYENYLIEYYCQNSKLDLEYYKCPHGCSDGKCVDKSPEEEANYIQDQCVYITNFHFNAAGDDNYNLNDEYVTFKNKCSYPIDMTSWTIRDETAYHVYTLPSFTFEGGTTFTLYTGTGINTNSAMYWGRTSGNYAAIWNNQEGDTLFLKDSSGNIVLSQSYVGY